MHAYGGEENSRERDPEGRNVQWHSCTSVHLHTCALVHLLSAVHCCLFLIPCLKYRQNKARRVQKFPPNISLVRTTLRERYSLPLKCPGIGEPPSLSSSICKTCNVYDLFGSAFGTKTGSILHPSTPCCSRLKPNDFLTYNETYSIALH